MKPMFPIYVPSKGRSKKASTLEILAAAGLRAVVVVEPQDIDTYREAFLGKGFQFLVLPENNRGITYVRNHILKHAREQNEAPWFWVLDDDIQKFHRVENSKSIPAPANEVLAAAEELFQSDLQVAIGALEYQQFAWSSKRDRTYNSYCDVAVCINLELTKHQHYFAPVELKEDRDFVLQALSAGMRSMRAGYLAFSAPKNGSNQGGLFEQYQTDGREARASEAMARRWPGICTPILKPDGRPDVKINWKTFKLLT